MRLLIAIARSVRFAGRVAARTRHVGLLRTAGSLAFTTLLGLVPLATVAFSFVARFPFFQDWLDALESFLLQHMLPGSADSVVHSYIGEFTEKAARLTGVSIAFVGITAVLVIATIEREINAIWGIRRGRPLARRLFVYTIVATVGPVLVGASISLTTWLLAQSLAAVSLRESLGVLAVKALPIVFSLLALALLYALTPARKVPWRHAFAGALAAALAFEGAKLGFAFYITHVPTYEVVYGALAALPVFLIWLYLCWLIVLTGAAITATLTLAPDEDAQRRRLAHP